MTDAPIGGSQFRIHATGRSGRWVAYAERIATGDRFGPESVGSSEAEAVSWLARWLDWQTEHSAALQALQEAERAYHRTLTAHAFNSPAEGPDWLRLRKESLELLEATRIRLDTVRDRRPL